MRISLKEAENLIAEYFSTFPKIRNVLNFLGKFGVQNGYISSIAPYNRRRVFPTWHFAKQFIHNHLNDPVNGYNATLGAIERQSKNQPIQGTCADITKLAMGMIYKWIRQNGYVDKINLVLQVHDEIQTVCASIEIAEMWKPVMDKLMCDAAAKIITSGILKADTQITSTWTK